MEIEDGHRRVGLIDLGPWPGHSETYTVRVIQRLKETNCRVSLLASADFETPADELVVPSSDEALHRFIGRHSGLPLVDLSMTATLRSAVGTKLLSGSMTTRVLHDVHLIRRSKNEPIRRIRGHARRVWFRRELRRSARTSRLIVHTTEAKLALGKVGVAAQLAPLPSLLPGETRRSNGRGSILMVGGIRPTRGFWHGFTAALTGKQLGLELVVVGVDQPPPDCVAAAARVLPRVPTERLLDLYRSAEIVLLPYPDSFESDGASSLVLQEALHLGAKVVATPWALSQARSANLFCSRSFSVTALERAIQAAVSSDWTAEEPQSHSSYLSELLWLPRC